MADSSGSAYYGGKLDLDGADELRRDGSSSQEWGEDRSHVDDSRSSQKSDAGYLSSGALSDGPHGERRGIYARAPAIAAFMMNGETRFPTAMSYMSDAQRSDVATVCSGSIADETEVESVTSQEDQQQLHSHPSSSGLAQEGSGAYHRYLSGGSRGVNIFMSHLPEAAMAMHSMGPPLNRALLLQRTEGSFSQPGSVGSNTGSEGMAHTHSDDGHASLDMESNWNQDDSHEASEGAKKNGFKPASRAGSVKSDNDDCACSLDVETHSVETRSIHSQDEAPHTEMIDESRPDALEESPINTFLDSDIGANGRRSPGGTIYKGRGIRRYQGRYMHLPLKRFHQNGVHLDSVDEGSPYQEPHHNSGERPNGLHHESTLHWDDPRRCSPARDGSPPRLDGFHRHQERSRSRSRSRSPPSDVDTKPRARRSPPSSGPNNGYRRDRSPDRDWSRR